jgi:hypothetical protein
MILLDGPRTVQITAAATGFKPAATNLQIIDFESLSLSLDAAAISENGGTTTGTVRRLNSDIDQPLVVSLLNGNNAWLNAPTTVTIPANQSLATFTVSAIDNQLLDGTRSVSLTASASGYESSITSVQLLDHESLLLTVDLPVISEAGGVAVATVRRTNTNNDQPLVVNLSGGGTIANHPASVTIAAGKFRSDL